jgi:hypothetical protein
MDPITLVLTALSAGAAAAAKDTVSQAIKDAYSGLKSMITNHFKGSKQAETTLDEFEKDPDTWRKPLEKTIAETRIGDDPDVIVSAQKVLQLVHPEQHAQGKFNVQTTGPVQGQQIGDYGTQQNVFGTTPPKP